MAGELEKDTFEPIPQMDNQSSHISSNKENITKQTNEKNITEPKPLFEEYFPSGDEAKDIIDKLDPDNIKQYFEEPEKLVIALRAINSVFTNNQTQTFCRADMEYNKSPDNHNKASHFFWELDNYVFLKSKNDEDIEFADVPSPASFPLPSKLLRVSENLFLHFHVDEQYGEIGETIIDIINREMAEKLLEEGLQEQKTKIEDAKKAIKGINSYLEQIRNKKKEV